MERHLTNIYRKLGHYDEAQALEKEALAIRRSTEGVAAVDVHRVLADCGNAVVAGCAGADDLRMVHREDWHPDVGVVAVLTDVCRVDMRRVLACRVYAVMAVETRARNAHVIEVCRHPVDGRMAVVAVVAALDMVGILARRRQTIVAGAAGADDLDVVDDIDR